MPVGVGVGVVVMTNTFVWVGDCVGGTDPETDGVLVGVAGTVGEPVTDVIEGVKDDDSEA